MVVKGDADTGIEGKVCRDIVLRDLHLAVLHILGMHELDLIDQIQLL